MASTGKIIPHQNQVVAVLIPFPAQGHLNQLLHLSHLILSHNIPVHYVSTVTHIRQAKLRYHNSISNIHFHGFEVPPFVSPPPNPNNEETHFPTHLTPSFEASSHLRDPLRNLLQSLSSQSKKVIVIHDSAMASVAQDAINMPNVENYTFLVTCAFTVYMFYCDKMGGRPSLENLHVPEFPSLEGCFSTQFKDFIIIQRDLHKFSDGFIYNTSRALEGAYVELMEVVTGRKNIWALGPFNPLVIEKNDSKGRHFCIEWLDKQEPNSVLYVSFGTTTCFKEEQIKQIAIGLEQSKQKFIWVLRDADKGNIFGGGEATKIEIPKGIEEKFKGMGLVVRDWAPQLEILSHTSTGGFMSHCGWNSCLESITMGVPIAAWPMHSDQPGNTVFITQVLKIGLVVKDWSQRNSLVSASVVENVVRRLMETKEGEEMRERAMKLKNSIHRSMDEDGVSSKEMGSFIAHITK